MKINLPPYSIPDPLKKIVCTYEEHGYECYLVGGSVRDLVLGRLVGDYDLATSALPQQAFQLFRRVLPTGIKHGTVTIMVKGSGYEVTTFRSESDYSDGRHPGQVAFSATLEEDLQRRDFTINALVCDIKQERLIDLHNGLKDIERSLIRAIGRPNERFAEDSLRILRACRFSSKLGFLIEKKTLQAMDSQKKNMHLLSSERIAQELEKTLAGAFPLKGFFPFLRKSLFKEIFDPGFNALFEHLTLRDFLKVQDFADVLTRFAFLCGLGSCWSHSSAELAGHFMRRLKASNAQIKLVTVALCLSTYPSVFYLDARLLRRIFDGQTSPEIIEAVQHIIEARFLFGLDRLERLRSCFAALSSAPLRIKDLALTGVDLKNLGFDGRAIGAAQRYLHKLVLRDPELNTSERLKRALSERNT